MQTRPLVPPLVGAVAGAVATVPMSALMWTAQRAGLMGTQPPRRITDEALEEVGADPPEGTRRLATAVNHLGFGAVAGALYAVVERVVPPVVPRAVVGAVYGVGVWASAYLGWVPALGIMPSAERDRPDRPVSMVAAHVVYGSVLGTLVRVLRRGPGTVGSHAR
jgi:hypothetical protein